MWLNFIFGYFLFCVGTGIMCSISLWPSMRNYIFAVSPSLGQELYHYHHYIAWFFVGMLFAPYLFWETIFGPSHSLTSKIMEVFLDKQI